MDKEESMEKNNEKDPNKRNSLNFYWPEKFVTTTLTPTTLTLAPNTFKIWKQEKFNLESYGSIAKESNSSKTNPTSQSSDANIISTVGNQVNAGGFSQPFSFDGNINEVGDDGNRCCGKNFEIFEPLASNSNINMNPRRNKRISSSELHPEQRSKQKKMTPQVESSRGKESALQMEKNTSSVNMSTTTRNNSTAQFGKIEERQSEVNHLRQVYNNHLIRQTHMQRQAMVDNKLLGGQMGNSSGLNLLPKGCEQTSHMNPSQGTTKANSRAHGIDKLNQVDMHQQQLMIGSDTYRSNHVSMNQPQQLVGTNIYGLEDLNKNEQQMIGPNVGELHQVNRNKKHQTIGANVQQVIGSNVYKSNQINLNQHQQEIGSLNQVNKNQLQTIRPDIEEVQEQQTIRPSADILNQVSMNQQEGTIGHALDQLEHVKINQQHQIVGPDIFGLNQDSASQQKMIGSNISNQVNGYGMQQTIATNDYGLNEVWMNQQQKEMIVPNCLDKAIGLQVMDKEESMEKNNEKDPNKRNSLNFYWPENYGSIAKESNSSKTNPTSQSSDANIISTVGNQVNAGGFSQPFSFDGNINEMTPQVESSRGKESALQMEKNTSSVNMSTTARNNSTAQFGTTKANSRAHGIDKLNQVDMHQQQLMIGSDTYRSNHVSMNQPQQLVGTNIYGLEDLNKNEQQMIGPNVGELHQVNRNKKHQTIGANVQQVIGSNVYKSNQIKLNQQQQEIGSLNQVNKNQRQTIRPDIEEVQEQQTIRPSADILNQVSMNQQEGTIGHALDQLEHFKINQQHQIVGPDIFGLNQDSASQQKMIGSNISNQVNGYGMQQTIATNDYGLNEVWMNQQQKEMIVPNCLDKAIGLQVNIGEMPNNTCLNLDQSILNNAANLNMMRNRLSKPDNMVNLMTVNKKYEYGSNNNINVSFNNNQPGISSNDACRSTNMSFDDQLGIAFSDFFGSDNTENYLMGFENQPRVNFWSTPCGSNMETLGMNNQSGMNFSEMRNLSIDNPSMGSLTDEFGSSIKMIDSGLNNQFGFEDVVDLGLIDDYGAFNKVFDVNFCGKDGLSCIESGSVNMSKKQNNMMAASMRAGSGSNNIIAEGSFNDKSKSNAKKNMTLNNDDEFNSMGNKLFNNQNGLGMENTSYLEEYGLGSMSFEDDFGQQNINFLDMQHQFGSKEFGNMIRENESGYERMTTMRSND
ncbi:probable cyclin-dependent serine/threonine-protein kinase DDB_G0292550 [Carica papaya]|uniref:probable cyclin-dependent serine/threonine-protein kinase DDB_G0292550 n=1 Tax=Carica papaya TaxID=3649 RepID=UPI000B8CCA7B|nr:probable cyclin-dependent serine/threonine-protein kinase DDB_G0292550 [Carica papaya]